MNEQINQMEQDTENKPSELSKLRGTDHEGFRRMIQRAVKRMQWRMKYRPSTSLFSGNNEQ
jgi:beta-galactosidase/beta-glucuronidase